MILGTYKHKNFASLKKITKTCIDCGIIGFDTAPSYQTEKILGKVLRECLSELQKKRQEIFIATKIDAWQMQDTNGIVIGYVDKVLKEMNLDYLDQLLIHWPIPEYFEKTWENLICIHKSGKAKVIGVSNVRERHLLKLMNCRMIPMVVQNERHPLRTDDNTLKFCKRNNIVYEAYSPVAQMNEGIRNSEVLQELSIKYNRSIGQIIMRWHLDTGSIPVFMTKKSGRIKEYSTINEFQLNFEDISVISSLNIDYKIFLESEGCPGF